MVEASLISIYRIVPSPVDSFYHEANGLCKRNLFWRQDVSGSVCRQGIVVPSVPSKACILSDTSIETIALLAPTHYFPVRSNEGSLSLPMREHQSPVISCDSTTVAFIHAVKCKN